MTDARLRDKLLFYDVESFPNMFLLAITYKDTTTGVEKKKAYRIKEALKAKPLFAMSGVWHVGFNSANYDDIMIAMLFQLGDRATDELMYEFNQRIIMGHKCPTDLCEYLYQTHVKEFDYYTKAGHKSKKSLSQAAMLPFGGDNRRSVDLFLLNEAQGSLKNAEIVLGRDIHETSVPFGSWLTEAQKDETEAYCFEDIYATMAVYEKQEPQMLVRDRFYAMGITDAHNIGSAKLGEKYVIRRIYGEQTPPAPTMPAEGIIPVSSMLAYPFAFTDTAFAELLAKLKVANLHYGREMAAWGDVEPPDEAPEFSKKEQLPSPYSIDNKFIAKGDLVITDARGMIYTFGVGGLHNDAPSGVWLTDDEWLVENVDVGSFYPSLMRFKNFVASHIPGFQKETEAMIIERFAAKQAGHIDADTLKLVLNATFGKMRERFSKIFDPKAHFSITINGQLLLLRLIDMVYDALPTATVINANTDGVCFHIRKEDKSIFESTCKAWETFSEGCVLEAESFEAWAQSNCNNYVAMPLNPDKKGKRKPKMKGSEYKIESKNLKDVDKVCKAEKAALIAYLLNGIHPRKTLETLLERNPMAFCAVESAGGEKVQFVCNGKPTHKKKLRYVIAKTGGDRYEKITHSKVGKVNKAGEVSEGISKACGGLPALSIANVADIDKADIDVEHYVESCMARIVKSYAVWTDGKEKIAYGKLVRTEGYDKAFQFKQWRQR